MLLYSCSNGTGQKLRGLDIMFTKELYIVCVNYPDMRDVKIDRFYEGEFYNLDMLIKGYEKMLKGLNIQVSKYDNEAYIDVINQDKMIERTYSFIKKTGLVTKPTIDKD